MRSSLFALLAAGMLVASCSHKNDSWKISGNIANAPEGAKMAVERLNGDRWITIDSLEIASDGTFSYSAAEGLPIRDVYRISYLGSTVYFPIDSIDRLTLNADANDFVGSYVLAGSALAERMMNCDKSIAEALANRGVEYVLADSAFRRGIEMEVVDDSTGILSYYLINKTVANHPLFSTDKARDLAIISSVANKFATNFPNDPRTAYLVQKSTSARQAMRSATGEGISMEATVSGIIDIELLDEQGRSQVLSQIADGAGVTVLNFTSYMADFSPALNVELNRLNDLFAQQGIKIYQVAFDNDNEREWINIAGNLPWTTVLCTDDKSADIALRYNLQTIPVTYIIDSNGDIVQRVDYASLAENPAALETAIRQNLH